MYTDIDQLARDRAEAWRVLLEQRARCLRPKDKDVTELDRKVLMDALCSQYEKDFMLADSLYEIAMVYSDHNEVHTSHKRQTGTS